MQGKFRVDSGWAKAQLRFLVSSWLPPPSRSSPDSTGRTARRVPRSPSTKPQSGSQRSKSNAQFGRHGNALETWLPDTRQPRQPRRNWEGRNGWPSPGWGRPPEPTNASPIGSFGLTAASICHASFQPSRLDPESEQSTSPKRAGCSCVCLPGRVYTSNMFWLVQAWSAHWAHFITPPHCKTIDQLLPPILTRGTAFGVGPFSRGPCSPVWAVIILSDHAVPGPAPPSPHRRS